jgi:hypothetical protein
MAARLLASNRDESWSFLLRLWPSLPLPKATPTPSSKRSVEANAADWKAAPDYDFVERDRQPGGGTKTYEELMILGSPYERLIAVNGKPLSPEQEAGEQQKLDATVVERKKEPQQEREKRIAKYEKDRRRDQLLMEQLTKALDFKLVGEQKLGAARGLCAQGDAPPRV